MSTTYWILALLNSSTLGNILNYLVEGNGNPLHYFSLENSMDKGAWQAKGSQRVGHSWRTEHTHRYNLHLCIKFHKETLKRWKTQVNK